MDNSYRDVRLEKLMEREKELNCLYNIEHILIDLHVITYRDIENKDSYAIMLTAVDDRARPIKTANKK